MTYKLNMLTSWRWTKHCSWLLATGLLASCSAQRNATEGVSNSFTNTAAPSAFAAQDQLRRQLNAEPQQCAAYRQDYVAAFALNVKGLSTDNSDLERQAEADFHAALQRFTVSLNEQQNTQFATSDVAQLCRIPQCIIEPLQEGKLTYWCGYRMDGVQGRQVNIWFEWDTLEPTR